MHHCRYLNTSGFRKFHVRPCEKKSPQYSIFAGDRTFNGLHREEYISIGIATAISYFLLVIRLGFCPLRIAKLTKKSSTHSPYVNYFAIKRDFSRTWSHFYCSLPLFF
jgi:hypothetical protein